MSEGKDGIFDNINECESAKKAIKREFGLKQIIGSSEVVKEIPEKIFENELFGHVKGAFTDACYNQAGLVKEAEGGTLFLDEIGAVSPYIQVKFLRLLQDKEYKPLGDPMFHKADIG